jgi:hypothetical protein
MIVDTAFYEYHRKWIISLELNLLSKFAEMSKRCLYSSYTVVDLYLLAPNRRKGSIDDNIVFEYC